MILFLYTPRQLNLASETIGIAVNIFDRFLALGSRRIADVKKIAVATLVLASKMHGRTLSAKQLVAPGTTTFSTADVARTEFDICKALDWNLTPVTPYEIMKYLMLWSAADGATFKNLILHAQLFIDYVLCDYAAMNHSPAAVAMSSLLHAHKLAKHSPKQWLAAIEEINLFPTADETVHACCYAMDYVYTSDGIGIPPKPVAGQDSPTSVTRLMTMPEATHEPESRASQSNGKLAKARCKRKSPAQAHKSQKVAEVKKPVKFHAAPPTPCSNDSGQMLKRPRAMSISDDSKA